MPKLGTIAITNQSPTKAVIDIEGIIGIPEWWQFDEPQDRVSTFDKFKGKCNEIKNLKATEVEVNIRSLGGATDHAFLIHDSLCSLDAQVTTICYGYTASAATIVAQAGEKRLVSSKSLYLVHQCMTVARGNLNAMNAAIDLMNKTNDRIINVYATRSNKPEDHFRELLNRNNGDGEWLSPEDTVANGFADEIIKVSGTVNLDCDAFSSFGYPEVPEDLLPVPDQKNVSEKPINKFMAKITNSFKHIWALLTPPDNVTEHEVTDQELQQINVELENRETQITNLTNERDQLKTTVTEKDTRIQELENQVADLKEKPGATTTQTTKPTDQAAGEGNVYADAANLYNSVKDL